MWFINSFSAVVILMFFSSTSFSQESEGIVAKRIKSTDVYNEKEFVVNVTDITIVDDRIVIVDDKAGKIVLSDLNLDEFQTFGTLGAGPQEFGRPYMLLNDIEDQKLYIYDNQKFRIWPIDMTNLELEKGFSFEFMMVYQTVAIKNSLVYFTSISRPEVDVLRYDIKERKQLSGIDLDKSSVESFMGRYILSSNDRFVVVSPYDGLVVDTFNKEWKLIDTKDLSTLPIVKKRLSMNRASGVSISGSGKNQINVKSGKSTISSMRLDGDDLYLLAYSRDKALKSRANVILKYTFKNKSWSPSGKIILPQENSYSTFDFLPDGSKIVAFDRENGTIDLFDIK
ncbi:hypothetical protein [Roseivirga sp.]|uniref:hypothetical protein n=1 Tax=Roseivirga sp. TaxID=1964215 RepID=UPI003B8C4B05